MGRALWPCAWALLEVVMGCPTMGRIGPLEGGKRLCGLGARKQCPKGLGLPASAEDGPGQLTRHGEVKILSSVLVKFL